MEPIFGPVQTNIESGVKNSFQATLALKLLDHFALVAGRDGGEDSAGRAKLALMSAEEVIDRCISLAELMTEKLVERGHLIPMTRDESLQELAAGASWKAFFQEASYRKNLPKDLQDLLEKLP